MPLDNKYGEVKLERGEIPDHEPIFILRAQDAAAIQTLTAYYDACNDLGVDLDHRTGIASLITTFRDWQEVYVTKVPDTQLSIITPGDQTK